MSQPAIEAPIVSTFDPKGVQQATKSLGGLEGAFKKFGIARKVTFAALTAAAVKYSKDAVRAAMADEKAQKNLTLALRNLGKEYAMTSVNDFIKRQERVTGVSKDVLRPELQKLILSTNTVGEAQELMSLALDVSAGSTNSLSKVIGALIKAQNGDTESLKKLNLGLSEATLSSGSMVAVTEELTQKFSGQAAVATDNLAGKMNSLKLVIGDVQEQIGKKMVDSINKLDAEQDVFKKLEANIKGAGDATVFMLDNLPKIVGVLEKISYYTDLARLGNLYAPEAPSNAMQTQSPRAIESGGTRSGFNNRFSEEQRFALRIRNSKIEIELARKRKDLIDKTVKKEKESAYTKKINQMFDNDLVSINAALQNKVTDEVRGRLIALRAAKTEDQNDDKTAIMELIALQKKRADDAVANWEAESTAAKKSFENQYADYLALVQKFKDNAIELNYKMRVQQVMENLPSQIQSTNPQVVAVADATAKVLGVTGATEARKQEAERAAVAPSLSPQVSSFLTQMREKQMQLEAENIVATQDLLDFANYATKVGQTVTSRAAVSPTIINNLEVRSGFIGNAMELSQAVAEAIQNATKAGFSIDVVGVP